MENAGFGTMTLDDIIRTVYADKVLREMLSEPTSSWDAFRARLELLGNRLPEHANVVTIVQFGTTHSLDDDMPSDDLRQRWRRMLEMVVGKDGAAFAIGSNRFGMLITQVERPVIEAWHRRLTEQTLLPISIGVGQPARIPADLSRSMNEARSALQMRFYLGNGVIHAEDLPPLQESCDEPLARTDELFEQYLHCTGIDDVRIHIGTFYRLLLEKGPLPTQKIYDISIRFLLGMERYLEQVSDGQLVFGQCDLMKLVAMDTIEALREQLAQHIQNMLLAVREHLSGSGRDIVSRILQEMEADCRNASLHGISQQLFLSPAYLSLLFKTSTGKTFTERLTDIRMQKAKQLLMNSEHKTYEVAEMVGYQDARYFSQIFRKKTGVLPSEYREWLLQPVFRDMHSPPAKEQDPLTRWQGSLLPTLDGTPSARLHPGGSLHHKEQFQLG